MIHWIDVWKPFHHLLSVDAAPDELLERVLAEWPGPNHPWQTFDNELERKRSSTQWNGPATVELAAHMESMAQQVADRLYIGGRIVPSFYGGGYHEIPVGGVLGIHVDFNMHPDSEGLYRRANVLLYMNRHWTTCQGGELILVDDPAYRTSSMMYWPEFNKAVAFPTGQTSWHGHPVPTTRVRRSFAMYLFSTEPPPDHPGEAHSTRFA